MEPASRTRRQFLRNTLGAGLLAPALLIPGHELPDMQDPDSDSYLPEWRLDAKSCTDPRLAPLQRAHHALNKALNHALTEFDGAARKEANALDINLPKKLNLEAVISLYTQFGPIRNALKEGLHCQLDLGPDAKGGQCSLTINAKETTLQLPAVADAIHCYLELLHVQKTLPKDAKIRLMNRTELGLILAQKIHRRFKQPMDTPEGQAALANTHHWLNHMLLDNVIGFIERHTLTPALNRDERKSEQAFSDTVLHLVTGAKAEAPVFDPAAGTLTLSLHTSKFPQPKSTGKDRVLKLPSAAYIKKLMDGLPTHGNAEPLLKTALAYADMEAEGRMHSFFPLYMAPFGKQPLSTQVTIHTKIEPQIRLALRSP